LKILGVPKQLLVVEIKWRPNFETVHISIKKLIVQLQTQMGMLNTTPVATPMMQKDKKFKEMQKKYRTIVGTFIFICHLCRPDIVYMVNVLCRAMANPSLKHIEAAKHGLRYLAGTADAGITYRHDGNRKPDMLGDAGNGADWTFRICICNMMRLAGGLILWMVKLLNEFALSTCEAEIRSIAAAKESVKSGLYVQKLFNEAIPAGIMEEPPDTAIELQMSTPLMILEDNKAAIDWPEKKGSSQKMRHIEKSLYWIRQQVQLGKIKLVHISTKDQWADIGTKPLSKPLFQSLAQRIISYHEPSPSKVSFTLR
jgi:hypothetical protein